jgi:hypothetical protein
MWAKSSVVHREFRISENVGVEVKRPGLGEKKYGGNGRTLVQAASSKLQKICDVSWEMLRRE